MCLCRVAWLQRGHPGEEARGARHRVLLGARALDPARHLQVVLPGECGAVQPLTQGNKNVCVLNMSTPINTPQ